MKKLLIRSLSGAVFVALIVTSFFVNPLLFNILFLAFSLIGVWEFINMSEKKYGRMQYVLPFCAAALLFSAFQMTNYSISISLVLFLLTLIVLILIPIMELYAGDANPVVKIGLSYLPIIWIVLPVSLLGFWAFSLQSASTVLALFILIWMCDTFAYCSGSLFGKHKLCERISPKKSWEGFIISFVLTCGLSVLFAKISYFQSPLFTTPWHWIGFAVVVMVASVFGDLVESLFKRSFDVKDSGNIMPGHGGILDRLDSLFFAAPAGFVYWMVFYLISMQ